MNNQLIAVIVDGDNGEDPAVQSLALATVTRILEHGGRVLLSADAATRLTMLLAAAEYVSPIDVENSHGRAAAPVIIAPFPGGDSLEERLFTMPATPEEEEETTDRPRRTLLSELIDSGIVEAPDRELRDDAPSSFGALLRTLRPAAVLTIGSSERTNTLQRTAEQYHRDEEGSRLLRLDGTAESRWPTLEQRVQRFRIPPRFEGELIADRPGDDALSRAAFHAAGEAARVLAIEDAVAEILHDEESITPDENQRV